MRSRINLSHFLARIGCLILGSLPLTTLADYRPGYEIVSEHTEIRIAADFSWSSVRTSSIKILEKSALEYLGESSYGYNADHGKVEVLEAYVTRPDGAKVPVTADGIKIKDEYVDEDAPIFSSDKKLYILFSELSVGSVITERVKRSQHTATFPGHFSWYDYASPYQRTRKATYRFVYPASMPLKFAKRGGYQEVLNVGRETDTPVGFASKSFTYTQLTYRPYEEGSVELFDYAPMLVASTFAGPAALAKAYDDRAAVKAEVTPEIKKLATELTYQLEEPREKVQALQAWVAQNIRYVGTYIGAGGFVPHSAQSVLQRRYGDCKDHVVLLEALLAAVGIESTAAMINLGEAYTLAPLTISSPFNHVITYVPILDLFVDSTARYARTGTLPASLLDKPTVLAKTGELRRTPNASSEVDTEVTDITWTLKPNGDMVGQARYSQTGWFETWARGYYAGYESTAKDRWIRNYLEKNGEIGSGSQLVPDSDDWIKPWVIESKTQLPAYVNLPARSAFRLPVGLTSGTINDIATSSEVDTRSSPWLCFSRRVLDRVQVRVPEGVAIEFVPKGVAIKNQHWAYRSTYRAVQGTIFIERELTLKFKTASCSSTLAREWFDFVSAVRRDVRGQIFIKEPPQEGNPPLKTLTHVLELR